MEKTKSFFKNIVGRASDHIDNSPLKKIPKIVYIIILIIILLVVGTFLFKKYMSSKNSKPWILKGTKTGKKRMVILQDPNVDGSITLERSKNKKNGLEFTYMFWIYIDDWTVNRGNWKHIMHKGNERGWPLRAPGIWLHPKKNAMRIFMNTFKKIDEYIDIPNIPLDKWFCVTVSGRQTKLDVYINGVLKKSKEFDSLMRQNYGDLFLTDFGGFGGFLSNVRYFDYYIDYGEMRDHLNRGPSVLQSCVDSNESPPYLSTRWWVEN